MTLLARLCAAEGASRELDAEINLAVFSQIALPCPAYTASLDDALTLVPDGCQWHCGTCNEDDQPWATLTLPDWSDRDAEAATVPLALCIAALRARGLPQ